MIDTKKQAILQRYPTARFNQYSEEPELQAKFALPLLSVFGLLGRMGYLTFTATLTTCYLFYKLLWVSTVLKFSKSLTNLYYQRKVPKSTIKVLAMVIGYIAGGLLSIYLALVFPTLLNDVVAMNYAMAIPFAILNGAVYGGAIAKYFKRDAVLGMLCGAVFTSGVLGLLMPAITHGVLQTFIHGVFPQLFKAAGGHGAMPFLLMEVAGLGASVIASLAFLLAQQSTDMYYLLRYGHTNADGYEFARSHRVIESDKQVAKELGVESEKIRKLRVTCLLAIDASENKAERRCFKDIFLATTGKTAKANLRVELMPLLETAREGAAIVSKEEADKRFGTLEAKTEADINTDPDLRNLDYQRHVYAAFTRFLADSAKTSKIKANFVDAVEPILAAKNKTTVSC